MPALRSGVRRCGGRGRSRSAASRSRSAHNSRATAAGSRSTPSSCSARKRATSGKSSGARLADLGLHRRRDHAGRHAQDPAARAAARLLGAHRARPVIDGGLAGAVARPAFVDRLRRARSDEEQVGRGPACAQRAQEGVAEHLRRGGVEQHVALVVGGVALAGETDRRERAGRVHEDDAVAREVAQRGLEHRRDALPLRGIGEIHGDVLAARRGAPREVDTRASGKGRVSIIARPIPLEPPVTNTSARLTHAPPARSRGSARASARPRASVIALRAA